MESMFGGVGVVECEGEVEQEVVGNCRIVVVSSSSL